MCMQLQFDNTCFLLGDAFAGCEQGEGENFGVLIGQPSGLRSAECAAQRSLDQILCRLALGPSPTPCAWDIDAHARQRKLPILTFPALSGIVDG